MKLLPHWFAMSLIIFADFSVKSFDKQGRLMRELSGEHAQHFPDTDTLDIQKCNCVDTAKRVSRSLLLQIRLWLKGTVRK